VIGNDERDPTQPLLFQTLAVDFTGEIEEGYIAKRNNAYREHNEPLERQIRDFFEAVESSKTKGTVAPKPTNSRETSIAGISVTTHLAMISKLVGSKQVPKLHITISQISPGGGGLPGRADSFE
jgi:hypothetical protein